VPIEGMWRINGLQHGCSGFEGDQFPTCSFVSAPLSA
jgi:hypothetical protein